MRETGQDCGRTGRFLRGLRHHGIAPGEGRSDLPAQGEERHVPGPNRGDDTFRDPLDTVAKRAQASHGDRLVLFVPFADDLGKSAKVVCNAGNLLNRDAARLSRIGDLRFHQFQCGGGHGVSDAVEQVTAVGSSHCAPRSSKRGLGGAYCCISNDRIGLCEPRAG